MMQLLKATVYTAFLMFALIACGGGGSASTDKMTITGAGS
jgi:hypothetical protein